MDDIHKLQKQETENLASNSDSDYSNSESDSIEYSDEDEDVKIMREEKRKQERFGGTLRKQKVGQWVKYLGILVAIIIVPLEIYLAN